MSRDEECWGCGDTAPDCACHDNDQYIHVARRVAAEANADMIEPIRLALVAISEERDAHWRRYLSRDARGKRCRRCEQPTPHTYGGRGLCARCYLHHGGGSA